MRTVAPIFVLTMLMLAMSGCSPAVEPEITVEELDGAFEPLSIEITGLSPGTTVALSAESRIDDAKYDARAEYLVGDDGTLDLARDVPTSGDWSVPDQMAPFWALTSAVSPSFEAWNDPYAVKLSITAESGAVLAETEVERPGAAPGIESRSVQEVGISGVYATPGDIGEEKRTAVLVFSGSDGGLRYAAATAHWLAGLGYPALAISYFGLPGQPQNLQRVPVETFETGLQWLRAQPEVDLERVFTYGVSRGGEMALWLAAEHPNLVFGAIAPVGSGVIVCGISYNGAPAWLRNGEPLSERCARTTTSDAPAGAAIEVGAISGPVVLACGTRESLWNSCLALDDIDARRSKSTTSETLATRQENASHFVSSPPYMPLGIESSDRDELVATRAAQVAFWNDVVEALSDR